MKKTWILTSAAVALAVAGLVPLLFTGCGKDLSQANTLGSSATTIIPCPTPRVSKNPPIFQRFEASSFSPWGGADIWTNTSQLSYATRTNIGSYDGCYSWWMQITMTP